MPATRGRRASSRERGGVEIALGKHDGCGGTVIYRSEPVSDPSQWEVRQGPQWEVLQSSARAKVTCDCDRCGQLFDHNFPPYQKIIQEYLAE